ILTVATPQAVLETNDLTSLDRGSAAISDRRSIVRMDRIEPGEAERLLRFRPRELMPLLVQVRAAPLRIRDPDDHRSVVSHDAETLLALSQRFRRVPPHPRKLELGCDAGQQLARAERLDEIVIGSSFETLDASFL